MRDRSCVFFLYFSVDDYLIFSRSLLEQASHTPDYTLPQWRQGGPKGEFMAIEADEDALFYLYKQKYNIDMAELRLTSELGVNKGKKPSRQEDSMLSKRARRG